LIGRRDERIDRINTAQFVGRKAEHLKGDVEKALQELCHFHRKRPSWPIILHKGFSVRLRPDTASTPKMRIDGCFSHKI
jgi:hypothetical protein